MFVLRTVVIVVFILGFVAIFCEARAQDLKVAGPGDLRPVANADPVLQILSSLPPPNLPDASRQLLSGAAANFLYGAWRSNLPQLEGLASPSARPLGNQTVAGASAGAIKSLATVNSRMLDGSTIADTESETSVAISGNHVVVGFNSSADFALGGSFSGYSFSNKLGRQFIEVSGGLPPAGFDSSTQIPIGDPSIVADAGGAFYYATLAADLDNNNISYIIIYKSTNHGSTFSPIAAVSSSDGFLDKELIAVDSNAVVTNDTTGLIYMSYTLFLNAGGPEIFTATFDTSGIREREPVRLTTEVASGSAPAIGPDGEVYVAWEQFSNTGGSTGDAIFIAKSIDQGANFGTPVKIADVSPVSDSGASTACGRSALKGGIRANDFPSIAVDTGSKSKFKATVYVTWNDMRNGDSDVLLAKSADGVTWSSPVRVNTNRVGDGSDQFMPWVNVMPNGKVAAQWYDRRNDPNNWHIDVFSGLSTNGGVSFANSPLETLHFPVIVNVDTFTASCYMGDYNQVANNGKNFFWTWGDNSNGDPDVVLLKR
jgi:hypothetical protein